MQYNLNTYVDGISELKWHSSSEVFYVGINDKKLFLNENNNFQEVVDGINVDVPSEKLERFLFKLYFAVAIHIGYGTQYEFLSPLLRRAEKLVVDFRKVFKDSDEDIFGEKNIAIVQLVNVNQDMIELVPSILTNQLFNQQVKLKQDGNISRIINVVIDEAHNLLYESNEDDVGVISRKLRLYEYSFSAL
jgi:hypothetical protein